MTKKKSVPKKSPSLNTKKHSAQNGRMSTIGRINLLDMRKGSSTDTRSSAERNKDYWHPIKGSWERFKTDWNLGRHPVQGLAKTFGVSMLAASAPAAAKALVFNPLGTALGFAGGVAGTKVGEHVDKKLGVNNLFSTIGGIVGGIKPYKYGTNVTKRALEIAMRTTGGLNRYKQIPTQLKKKDAINYVLTGDKQSLQNIVNDAAENKSLYQGFKVEASSPSEVPLEQDPISNYLYGTEPGWAKVVDGDDLGIHTEYVKTHYPNKKVRVFEVEPNEPFAERVSLSPSSTKPKIEPRTESFSIITPGGNSEYFDASGHLLEIIPESNIFRRQDIWKFNPKDYKDRHINKYLPPFDKLKIYYGAGLLDYHGTPFITRTPWLKENKPPSFNSNEYSNLFNNNEYSNLIKNNLTKSTEYIKKQLKI